jgi:hypothetical protein
MKEELTMAKEELNNTKYSTIKVIHDYEAS